MKRATRFAVLVLIVLFLLPVGTHALWWSTKTHAQSWRTADWSSAGLLAPPDAEAAQIIVYAAPVGRWRGIFAVHSWLVIKRPGATAYERYDVVGWGTPLRRNGWAPDGRWYGSVPRELARIEGERAAAAIPRLDAAIDAYPWSVRGDYAAWPGPNSNTFVATVLAAAPELRIDLPPNAIGKDFSTDLIAPTPSGTGLRLAFRGLAGLTVGWIEGVEINLFGLVAGVDLRRPALKLPGWGRIGLDPAPMS